MFEYMTDLQETENRSFEKMLRFAKECLLERPPQEIARKAGVAFDEDTSFFSFKSLGQSISVSHPEYRVTFSETGRPPKWIWIIIMLHYLAIADDTPIGSGMISFRELSGGLTRGQAFDRESADRIRTELCGKPEHKIRAACEALGAVFTKSNADICAEFYFLPRFPLTLKIWFADDELEGSGKMLLSSRSDHYLSTEDAVVAASMTLDFLVCQLTDEMQ